MILIGHKHHKDRKSLRTCRYPFENRTDWEVLVQRALEAKVICNKNIGWAELEMALLPPEKFPNRYKDEA
ncbi:hypothetical protein CC86DRAFT_400673 [Ophiobolus disseminans]|uniref:Uncharacterized protein n=1 Tax=Ophiobolus disseminans TaxID=1469910 RepID=A0A6A7AGP4_9PLEO|nr:hypothetical protein CC86DRAFT_400673 [Ophiobolus disseminans]